MKTRLLINQSECDQLKLLSSHSSCITSKGMQRATHYSQLFSSTAHSTTKLEKVHINFLWSSFKTKGLGSCWQTRSHTQQSKHSKLSNTLWRVSVSGSACVYLGEHHALALNPRNLLRKHLVWRFLVIQQHYVAIVTSMGSTSFANQQNDAQDYWSERMSFCVWHKRMNLCYRKEEWHA